MINRIVLIALAFLVVVFAAPGISIMITGITQNSLVLIHCGAILTLLGAVFLVAFWIELLFGIRVPIADQQECPNHVA